VTRIGLLAATGVNGFRIMHTNSLSTDTVAAIVLGILQLGIGLVSLWQQRQLRRAYRKCALSRWVENIDREQKRGQLEEEILFDIQNFQHECFESIQR
jgi:uncharacterized protein HemX